MKNFLYGIVIYLFIGENSSIKCQHTQLPSLIYLISASQPTYYCTTPLFDVYFFEDKISYVLKKSSKKETHFENLAFSIPSYFTSSYRMDMKWLKYNSNQLKIVTSDSMAIKTNYYKNNQLLNETKVGFAELIYQNIYEHVDMRFYFKNNQLKYDFIVKKGGDYGAIQLFFDGGKTMLKNNNKQLIINTPLGNVMEELPEVYQLIGGKKNILSTNYELKNNTINYVINAFNSNYPIIIDPFAIYFGGSDIEEIYDVKIDSKDNSYIVGYTNSTDLPTVAGVLQDSIRSFTDAFVAKFDTLENLVWVTYYGGSSDDFGYKLVIDSLDNLYLIGYTSSNDLLVSTSDVFQLVNNGSIEAFILKLDANGNFLKATYFGGTGGEITLAADIDNNQNITIGGFTSSMDMPILNAFQSIHGGALDAFVAQFDTSLNLIWSSYYGGSNSEDVHALTTDNQNNIIFVGESFSSNFPTTTGAFQQGNNGSLDGFIVKFSPTGNRIFATLFGGLNDEDILSVTTDNTSNIYIGGYTKSFNFPTIGSTIFQPTKEVGSDAFLTKLSPQGTPLFSSFYGGSGDERFTIIKNVGLNQVIASGFTSSNDLILLGNTFQSSNNGFDDLTIYKLDSTLTPNFISYFGGNSTEVSFGLATNSSNAILLSGHTLSTNFPISPNAYQTTNLGQSDGFLIRIDSLINPITTTDEIVIKNNSVTIYPNPSHKVINIMVSDFLIFNDLSIEIYSVDGNFIFYKNLINNSLKIETASFSKGIYILKLKQKLQTLAIKKIIIN